MTRAELYQRLRELTVSHQVKVEYDVRITARAARTNSDKRETGFFTRLLMPIVMKTFGAKAFTKDQQYRIDWDAQVSR
ncbi:hypothetical protein G7043_42365 [Lentzea sp. NEAU-D13]|uniref:Uncharacterized protein n=1 Tax=Lentzea alba TaxID=2714351 RepID=A0A7C9W8P5_9PSEU|nr:hypothetical protein [Lentzea alba]NGY65559.1 hypothetical protein [Lentzea alba]